jgi:hypothetical protein
MPPSRIGLIDPLPQPCLVCTPCMHHGAQAQANAITTIAGAAQY